VSNGTAARAAAGGIAADDFITWPGRGNLCLNISWWDDLIGKSEGKSY